MENAEDMKLDFILVVGGWDSSNTAHLLEIPQKAGVRSFHINKADCIGADNTITHRTMSGDIVTEKFIEDIENKDRDIIMGVTSGASTPDAAVQDSLSSIFLLKKMSTAGGGGDAAASSSGVKLWSVDYDAAARLAYEAAGSEGEFDAFKSKYLEETSEMVGKKGLI